MKTNTEQKVIDALLESSNNFILLQSESKLIAEVSSVIIEKIISGGKVMFCGNGGSAADARSFRLRARNADHVQSAQRACVWNVSALTKFLIPIELRTSCRGGGIGRRTWFRSMRWQHCGGSSPFLGTTTENDTTSLHRENR